MIQGQNYSEELLSLEKMIQKFENFLKGMEKRKKTLEKKEKVKKVSKRKKFFCIDCNKEISFGSKRCLSCHNEKRRKDYIVLRKKREEILQEYTGRKTYKLSNKQDLMDKANRYYRG